MDSDIVGQLRRQEQKLRVLVMPDHPTPVSVRTHTPDPVPFLLWGPSVEANGASRLTEAAAQKTGLFIEDGYKIMARLLDS